MGLPGHRRTSSDKRRRAAHFALKKEILVVDKKTGATHRPHRAAPGALTYNGHKIHRKGADKKMEKLLKKVKTSKKTAEHDHAHEGHTH
ncbi:50S ribosomal protein L32 [Candidatus Uhrbacteria bacterium]|nr:50S ribosomal protein L32 [Candidatus Uhrbacteria bacterium]